MTTKENVYTKRYKLYSHLLKAGARGLTDEEMQLQLSMNPSTQRPRRIELQRMGRIYEKGGWRMTRSGRRAVVWLAKPKTEEQES